MLSPADIASCTEALERVRQAAELAALEAESADTWWARNVLGAETTVDAMRSDAAATRRGYETLQAKLDRWTADPASADHADALDFLRSADAFADCSELLAAAQALDAGNTLATVAAETAGDVAGYAAAAGRAALSGLPWLVLGAVALVGLWLFRGWRR